jgi:hypothetical protein
MKSSKIKSKFALPTFLTTVFLVVVIIPLTVGSFIDHIQRSEVSRETRNCEGFSNSCQLIEIDYGYPWVAYQRTTLKSDVGSVVYQNKIEQINYLPERYDHKRSYNQAALIFLGIGLILYCVYYFDVFGPKKKRTPQK